MFMLGKVNITNYVKNLSYPYNKFYIIKFVVWLIHRYRLSLGLFPAIRLSQFPMNTNLSFWCPIELGKYLIVKLAAANKDSGIYVKNSTYKQKE